MPTKREEGKSLREERKKMKIVEEEREMSEMQPMDERRGLTRVFCTKWKTRTHPRLLHKQKTWHCSRLLFVLF